MGTIVLYIILAGNALASLLYPRIGIVLTYLIAVLTPQYIWWWVFEDVRPVYWIFVPTLIGFAVAALQEKIDFSRLNTRINWCVAVLWLTSVVAFYFGPYVDVHNDYRFYDPALVFSTWQKTLLAYFVAVALVDSSKQLKAFSIVMVITAAYMTLWANEQYFVFNKFGRLHGPRGLAESGIYFDENNFAVLFVVGFPFLYYFGHYLNNKVISLVSWAIIPFSWHAIFLTGSRGALLGIAAVLFVFAMRSERKLVGMLVIICFVGAFVWQAGAVMKNRSSTIGDYEEDESSAGRVDAWDAATGMMAAHPITGAGFSSFGQAFPDFSDKRPRIAHNAFFQIGGECGVLAGLTYLLLMVSTLNSLRTNGSRLRKTEWLDQRNLYYCLNEACLLGLTGFFVCSLFLSIEKYEVLYYLLILSNGTLVLSRKLFDELNHPVDPGSTSNPAELGHQLS